MSEPVTNEPPTATDLSGVPGLGPVRRRILAEAGITTRAELAQATLEQIIAVTGMPRAAAEQVARFVEEIAEGPGNPPAPNPGGAAGEPGEMRPSVERTDSSVSPAAPPESGAGGAGIADVPGEDAPQTTRLERAALRAQTAIADASRRAEPGSKLDETLVRFARLTDELPRRVTPETRGGVLRRITERIEAIAERLETVATGKKDLGSKRAKRLQQRLKRTRDSIKRTLKSSASNSAHKDEGTSTGASG